MALYLNGQALSQSEVTEWCMENKLNLPKYMEGLTTLPIARWELVRYGNFTMLCIYTSRELTASEGENLKMLLVPAIVTVEDIHKKPKKGTIGNFKQKCPGCDTTFRYFEKDIGSLTSRDFDGGSDTEYWIDCPNCEFRIRIRGY